MGSESSKPTSGGKRHSRRLSTGSGSEATNGSATGTRSATSSGNIAALSAATTKFGASHSENFLGAGLSQESRSRSGSASLTASGAKPKKSPIPLKHRQLIQSCFQNPHENLGKRILKRTAEKRKAFAKFYCALNFEQKDDIEDTIKTLLKKCVANIEFIDEVQRLANEFGGQFVKYRSIGFKADYFTTIGDATITECVFLDNAVHQAHQTLNAFSQFITMLLTSVRDGFYNEMKRLRRTSNSLSTGSNGSNERKTTAAGSGDVSPRSISPAAESINKEENEDEEERSSPDQEPQASSQQHDVDEKENIRASKSDLKPAESVEEDRQPVQKLSRADAVLKCDTVIVKEKESRTVTFQCAELNTAELKKSQHNHENEEEYDKVAVEKSEHHRKQFDTTENNSFENKQNEEKPEENIDVSKEPEKEEKDKAKAEDEKGARTESAIISANLPQNHNAHRKSLLPPSVAAIFES